MKLKQFQKPMIIFGAFALMTLVFYIAQIELVLKHGLRGYAHFLFDSGVYARSVIAPNYFDYGFMRRGLGGTIASLLTRNPVKQWFTFLVVSQIFLCLPLSILIGRLSSRTSLAWTAFATTVLLLSPQTFLSWSLDLGRTDMLAAGFIVWSLLAVLAERRWLAVILVLVGSLVHEVAFIFGAPLLTALFLQEISEERISPRAGLTFLVALLLLFGVITAVQFVLVPSAEQLSIHMMHDINVADPENRMSRDLAIYMAVGGANAIRTAMCLNFGLNPNYFYTIAFCLIILACYVVLLRLWDKPLRTALAALMPVTFMLVIANDTGRWLDLGVLNCWLLAEFRAEREGDLLLRRPLQPFLGMTILACLIWMGVTTYSDVNGFTRSITNIAGRHFEITFKDWLSECDPNWRKLLYASHVHTS